MPIHHRRNSAPSSTTSILGKIPSIPSVHSGLKSLDFDKNQIQDAKQDAGLIQQLDIQTNVLALDYHRKKAFRQETRHNSFGKRMIASPIHFPDLICSPTVIGSLSESPSGSPMGLTPGSGSSTPTGSPVLSRVEPGRIPKIKL